MIGVGILRIFFLASIMTWYTASVWQTIDKYFRDQFQEYLQSEYESNIEIKRDVMKEAEKAVMKKALLEKISKIGISKEVDSHLRNQMNAENGQDIYSAGVQDLNNEMVSNEEITNIESPVDDTAMENHPIKEGSNAKIIDNSVVLPIDKKGETCGDNIYSSEDCQSDNLNVYCEEKNEGIWSEENKNECVMSEFDNSDDSKVTFKKLENIFDEDSEMCRLDAEDKDKSCTDSNTVENEDDWNN